LFKTHFSEHQNTESGVQEFSLKTVTLEILEQLCELVNFLKLFKSVAWTGICTWGQKCSDFSLPALCATLALQQQQLTP
jgi:hypothetical protein